MRSDALRAGFHHHFGVADRRLQRGVSRTLRARCSHARGSPVFGVCLDAPDALERAERCSPNVCSSTITLGDESGFGWLGRVAALDGRRGGNRPWCLSRTTADEDFADLIAECPAKRFSAKCDLSAEAIRRMVARQR